MLWLRPRGVKMALAATETVLATGFALVILDLGLLRVSRRRFDDAVWLRLARRARFHDAALFVLAPYRVTGTAARIVLAADAARAGWDRAWQNVSLLDGLSARLVVEKNLEKREMQTGKTSLLNLSLLDAVQAGKKERRKEKEEKRKKDFTVENGERKRFSDRLSALGAEGWGGGPGYSPSKKYRLMKSAGRQRGTNWRMRAGIFTLLRKPA